MACLLRGCFSGGHKQTVGQLEVPVRRVALADFDPEAHSVDEKKAVNVNPKVASEPIFSIEIQKDDMPPKYPHNELSSVVLLSDVVRLGLQVGKDKGLPNVFNSFRHRHISIWIDDNSRLPQVTIRSIQMFSVLLLAIGKALDSDMEIYFTSQSNTESENLTSAEKAEATALKNLFLTKSWSEAYRIVKESQVLQKLGLLDWMEKESEKAEPSTVQQEQEPTGWLDYRPRQGPQDIGKGSDKDQASRDLPKQETPKEKFARLLSHVRELMIPLWQGYSQQELELKDLINEHNKALQYTKRQPKLLNSLRFTYEREIERYLRAKKNRQASPTTVLLLTGSPLQPTEADKIVKFQQTKKVKKSETVEGGGTEFCIQTVAFVQHMDEASKNNLRKVDDGNEGEDDINDLTQVWDENLLTFGPSELLLLKIINGHMPVIDNMKIKDAEKYGKAMLYKQGQPLVMPSVHSLGVALGQREDIPVGLAIAQEDNSLGSAAEQDKILDENPVVNGR